MARMVPKMVLRLWLKGDWRQKVALWIVVLAPLSLPLSGNFYDGSENNQGNNGNWWSSTANDGNNAYNLNVNSNGNVNPANNDNKNNGNSVRCVFGS